MPFFFKKISGKFLIGVLKAGAGLRYLLLFLLAIPTLPLRLAWRVAMFPFVLYVYQTALKGKRIAQQSFHKQNTFFFSLTRRSTIHLLVLLIAFSALAQNIFAQEAFPGEEKTPSNDTLLFALLPSPYADEEIPISALALAESNGTVPLEELLALPLEEEPPEFIEEEGDVLGALPIITTTLSQPRKEILTYTVEDRDTVSLIAEKFGISQNSILWENRLSSPDLIRPGQALRILPTSGVSHKVKKGDTIEKIAKKYGAESEKIREFNQLADDELTADALLIVPGGRMPRPRAIAPQFALPSAPVPLVLKSGEGMLWPSPIRKINQYFSWRHPGIDVDAEIGTAVWAALPGTVIFSSAGWNGGYGTQVLIDHGGGLVTRYSHNSKNLVIVGERVEKGQTIALGGSTGRSTGAHIHFEVIVNRTRVNPLHYFK